MSGCCQFGDACQGGQGVAAVEQAGQRVEHCLPHPVGHRQSQAVAAPLRRDLLLDTRGKLAHIGICLDQVVDTKIERGCPSVGTRGIGDKAECCMTCCRPRPKLRVKPQRIARRGQVCGDDEHVRHVAHGTVAERGISGEEDELIVHQGRQSLLQIPRRFRVSCNKTDAGRSGKGLAVIHQLMVARVPAIGRELAPVVGCAQQAAQPCQKHETIHGGAKNLAHAHPKRFNPRRRAACAGDKHHRNVARRSVRHDGLANLCHHRVFGIARDEDQIGSATEGIINHIFGFIQMNDLVVCRSQQEAQLSGIAINTIKNKDLP